MKIKILGCHGSELPGYHLCCFLINDSFVLDAGAITSTLPFSKQKEIKHILITHPHLDHIKDIAFLADNIQSAPSAPINLISSQEALDIIKAHLLNNKIWPDFTKLPDPKHPILKYHPIKNNTPAKIDGLEIMTIKVNHVVPTVAYLLSDHDSTVMFSADTGATEEIWQVANKTKNLKAIFIDTAFPNKMQDIADKSKHLTPKGLKTEIEKLNKNVEIFCYHKKSTLIKEINKELKELCPQIKTIKEGQTLIF
ncbi:MAG: 3',5'-cyclic-nucleotide phosphodiesterase [Candidatus Saganbacteria bacterium]|nr:3',5'-cyclic-nucleotide phosphodiesterase [Candidatus Saganbacteria bacterium]